MTASTTVYCRCKLHCNDTHIGLSVPVYNIAVGSKRTTLEFVVHSYHSVLVEYRDVLIF